jgi:hypothetical protein
MAWQIEVESGGVDEDAYAVRSTGYCIGKNPRGVNFSERELLFQLPRKK